MTTHTGKELEHLSTNSQGSIHEEEMNKCKMTAATVSKDHSYNKPKVIETNGNEAVRIKSKKWTLKENSTLFDGLIEYGNDITRLKNSIPTRTIDQLVHHEKSIFARTMTNLECLKATFIERWQEESRKEEIKRILFELCRKTEKMKHRIIETSVEIANDVVRIIKLFAKISKSKMNKIFFSKKKEINEPKRHSSNIVIGISDGDITESDSESENEDNVLKETKKSKVGYNKSIEVQPTMAPVFTKTIEQIKEIQQIKIIDLMSRKRERDMASKIANQSSMRKNDDKFNKDCGVLLNKEKDNMNLLSSFFTNPLFFLPPSNPKKELITKEKTHSLVNQDLCNNIVRIMADDRQMNRNVIIPMQIDNKAKSNAFNISFEEQISLNNKEKNDRESLFFCNKFDNLDQESSMLDYNNMY